MTVLTNKKGLQSLVKTNLYRAGVGQTQAANNAGADPTTYCKNYATSGLFIAQNQKLFTGATSPDPAAANNLFTFLANRESKFLRHPPPFRSHLTNPPTHTRLRQLLRPRPSPRLPDHLRPQDLARQPADERQPSCDRGDHQHSRAVVHPERADGLGDGSSRDEQRRDDGSQEESRFHQGQCGRRHDRHAIYEVCCCCCLGRSVPGERCRFFGGRRRRRQGQRGQG